MYFFSISSSSALFLKYSRLRFMSLHGSLSCRRRGFLLRIILGLVMVMTRYPVMPCRACWGCTAGRPYPVKYKKIMHFVIWFLCTLLILCVIAKYFTCSLIFEFTNLKKKKKNNFFFFNTLLCCLSKFLFWYLRRSGFRFIPSLFNWKLTSYLSWVFFNWWMKIWEKGKNLMNNWKAKR